MATYVFSDIHGHAAPFRRLIERIAPADDDRFYCLGDIIDRGPDPLDAIRAVRELPNSNVILGNHEDLMLDYFRNPATAFISDWSLNGGEVTRAALNSLSEHERLDLIDWFDNLPCYAVCTAKERLYALVHAGVLPYWGPEASWDEQTLGEWLGAFNPQDLMWVRYEFWCHPTGLVNQAGEGPIVIAGHTPTRYLDSAGVLTDRALVDEQGICQSVRAGDPDACGGVWDKWNIDSGAAGGAGFGRITVIRLEDGEEFTEHIGEEE